MCVWGEIVSLAMCIEIKLERVSLFPLLPRFLSPMQSIPGVSPEPQYILYIRDRDPSGQTARTMVPLRLRIVVQDIDELLVKSGGRLPEWLNGVPMLVKPSTREIWRGSQALTVLKAYIDSLSQHVIFEYPTRFDTPGQQLLQAQMPVQPPIEGFSPITSTPVQPGMQLPQQLPQQIPQQLLQQQPQQQQPQQQQPFFPQLQQPPMQPIMQFPQQFPPQQQQPQQQQQPKRPSKAQANQIQPLPPPDMTPMNSLTGPPMPMPGPMQAPPQTMTMRVRAPQQHQQLPQQQQQS